jgi:copper homeostasis protein
VVALYDVLETGAARILTSGGAPDAFEGRAKIARMVKAASGRIAMMAGGGITSDNIAAIVQETGVEEFHATARVDVASPGGFRKNSVTMGSIAHREYQRSVADPEKVRALLEAATRASATATALR